jgi:hypothetical protein
VPDVEQGGGDAEDDWAEDDAEGAEDCDAAEDGDEDDGGVGAQVSADEDGVEDVVDSADDEAAPDGEEGSFAPVAVEAEIDSDRSPDEKGAEGGDHGEGGEGDGPQENAGNAEHPEGESGEYALYKGDGEAAEEGGVDGVVDAFEQFSGFVFAERNDGAEGRKGELTVAKEKEEEKEHDDELGDEVDRIAENDRCFAADVSSGGAGCVVDVDGGGEGFNAVGECGMVADVVGEQILGIWVAEGDDGAESVLAQLLREEEAGDDDGQDDEDKGDGGAESAVGYAGTEPVVGNFSDDGENDGSDDGGEEGLEDERAEDQNGDGEEEEGDLPPWGICAVYSAFLHVGSAPVFFVRCILYWLRLEYVLNR